MRRNTRHTNVDEIFMFWKNVSKTTEMPHLAAY